MADSDYRNGIIVVVGLARNERVVRRATGLMAAALSVRERLREIEIEIEIECEREREREGRYRIVSPKIYFKLARPIMRNSVLHRVAVRFALPWFRPLS